MAHKITTKPFKFKNLSLFYPSDVPISMESYRDSQLLVFLVIRAIKLLYYRQTEERYICCQKERQSKNGYPVLPAYLRPSSRGFRCLDQWRLSFSNTSRANLEKCSHPADFCSKKVVYTVTKRDLHYPCASMLSPPDDVISGSTGLYYTHSFHWPNNKLNWYFSVWTNC